MGLYPKQTEIVNQLNLAYQRNLPITENHYFLSGEMGVGKTYMGAKLAIDHANHGVIIMVPNIVSTKWVSVLSDMTKSENITLVDNKFCQTSKLNFQPGHINVIPNQYFNRLFDTEKVPNLLQQWQNLGLKTIKALDEWVNQQCKTIQPTKEAIKYQRSLNYLHYQIQPAFLIYDEIHQAKNSKLACLDTLFHPEYQVNKMIEKFKSNVKPDQTERFTRHPALFLTGTIFNVDSHALVDLLMVTNNKLLSYQNIRATQIVNNITIFLAMIWRYISVSIALTDIKKADNNIHQTVLPIKSIELSPIEQAFYELVLAQLTANQTTNSRIAQRKNQLLASNLLDYPERQPIKKIKMAKHKDTYLRYDQNVLLSLPLKHLTLSNTKKYQTLLKYLNQYKDKSTVIYATDYQLITKLVNVLNHQKFNVTSLPKSIHPSEYSQYINQALAEHKIIVVNPKDITVGIDINAELLIWYQLLTDMTSIIQAQRRVYRLNSQHTSDVLFLPYQLTYQEQLVNDISNSAKNNAASYGIQDRSELAKKTNILLDSITQTIERN